MKTREEAEKRALELYPDNSIPNSTTVYQSDIENEQKRDAYIQCWDDMQVANEARQAADEVDNDKLIEAAEKVVKFWKMNPSLVDDWERDMDVAVEQLEKALK